MAFESIGHKLSKIEYDGLDPSHTHSVRGLALHDSQTACKITNLAIDINLNVKVATTMK
jgi:hypothetical protein